MTHTKQRCEMNAEERAEWDKLQEEWDKSYYSYHQLRALGYTHFQVEALGDPDSNWEENPYNKLPTPYSLWLRTRFDDIIPKGTPIEFCDNFEDADTTWQMHRQGLL